MAAADCVLLIVCMLLLTFLAVADDIITYEQLGERGITHLYMIGDIHGALSSLLSACIAAELCNQHGEWIKPNCILVQVGDLIHRGPDSVGVVRTLKMWQQEAPKFNSQVIVLRGNHEQVEIEQTVWNDHDAVFYEFGEADKACTSKQFRRGTELGEWIRALPIIQIIGEFVFVHAGIRYDWLTAFDTNVTAINEFARLDASRKESVSAWKTKHEAMTEMLETRMLHPGYSPTPALEYAAALDASTALAALNRKYKHLRLNVRSVAIGHNNVCIGTIQCKSRLRDARVVFLDSGHVDGHWTIGAYDIGKQALLYLNQDTLTTTSTTMRPRRKTTLWSKNHLEISGNFSRTIC